MLTATQLTTPLPRGLCKYPNRNFERLSLLIGSARRKVDWRMLPLLSAIYAFALIDRTNLGIARTVGMDNQLVSPV